MKFPAVHQSPLLAVKRFKINLDCKVLILFVIIQLGTNPKQNDSECLTAFF